jgi:hypothetical protein
MFQKGVLGPGCANVVGIVRLRGRRGGDVAWVPTLEVFVEKFIPLPCKEKGHALPDSFSKGLRFWERSQNKSIVEV